jgi:hypothetical protein
MSNKDFVHLHAHTHFSVQDALPSPKNYATKAREMGFSATAITDHGKMSGVVEFVEACRTHNDNFDPIKQTLDRIASLEMTGHIEPTPNNPCKLEFIVSGGTFNFYPKDYMMDFMTCLYYACNCYYDFQKFLHR